MRRLVSGFLIVLLFTIMAVPAAVAVDAPTVSLQLNKPVVPVGETAVLTVQVAGAADLYGSSIDVFYDPSAVMPVVSEHNPGTNTSAIGKVTDLLSPAQYFTSAPAGPGRQSLVAVRVGTQPGANGNGILGTIEFMGVEAGRQASFDLASNVIVKLVSSTGTKITPALAPAVALTVVTSAPLSITAPSPDMVIPSNSVTVHGTAPAGASVAVHLSGPMAPSQLTQANDMGTFSTTFSGLADGAYTVTATVGNESTPSGRRFYVDTAPPVVSISHQGPVVSPLTINLSVAEANLQQLFVQVNESGEPTSEDQIPLSENVPPDTVTVDLVPGNNTITVTARDKAGHAHAATLSVSYTMPVLKLVPRSAPYKTFDVVQIDGVIDNLPPNLHGLSAELQYDPNRLDLGPIPISFQGSVLEGHLQQTLVDASVPGKLKLNIVNPNGPNPGTALAFTLGFVAKDLPDSLLSASTLVFFSPLTVPDSTGGDGVRMDDNFNGVIPNGVVPDTNVTIVKGGVLTGQVDLLGRTDDSGAKVELFQGTTLVTFTDTDSTGAFTFGIVPQGEYELLITRDSYVATRVVHIPVVAPHDTSLHHLGITLIPGNIRDNSVSKDAVFLEDLGAMARAWGTQPLTDLGTQSFEPKWDVRADLDGSGGVYSSDLAILAEHWGKAGALSSNPSTGTVINYEPPMN